MKNTLIIAEIGVNHNGSMDLAKKLIDVAAEAGVDYVKFQTFKTENLVLKGAVTAEYQKKNLNNKSISQFEMLKSLELSPNRHFELIKYCHSKNVKFLSSAFDLSSLDFLAKLNLGLWKIPSGEITNYPYLKFIAKQNNIVLLSTGMSSLDEVASAISVLLANGLSRDKIILLQCNTEYPTPMEDVNLLAMKFLSEKFNVKVGYSDHTLGIEIPIAAVALGASVIEKHITLDRHMIGPDHKASLEPQELKQMVVAIRNVEKALGSGTKKITDSEYKNRIIARKSIVASRFIKAGEVFSDENLTVKRPGDGMSPMEWENVIGKSACKDFLQDEQISLK